MTVLKNRKSNTIRNFFFILDIKSKVIVTDLFMQFRNVINSSLGDVEIVADKYRFVRRIEWMIRDLRTRMYNSNIKFKDLKKYWKLLATRPSKLSYKQLEVLKRLKALDTKIRDCYGYKESLYLASTFRNWQKEIENSVKYGINNEFVEGNNNKIKVLKRLSYGIKNFETLKNLIQLSIS